MIIHIVVPFEDAETKTAVWAQEEREIDFRQDARRAARCTTAFAATELKYFLSRTLTDVKFTFTSRRPKGDFFIDLRITDPASKNEAFVLEPCDRGIDITGQGRTGVLYGAYEFLRMQGWRWFAPGPDGEIAPDLRGELTLPQAAKTYRPSFDMGRGFDLEGVSKESAFLFLWMARNRLNISGYRPATGPLCEKLGMSAKIGGHIFEAILDPNRALPSGKTLWEVHPAWYGLPADGVRKKEEALRTQFCVSQPDLMEFLGEELLRYVMGEWKQADRVDIWGFDTWGSTCRCPGCLALGNSTDQALHFMSSMRDILNRARRDGRLDHDVRLATCAYEGTSTIDGPRNPVPRNLIEAGDYVTFYPINRCYVHDFTESSCSWNEPYAKSLKSWFAQPPSLPVMIGEYYNVSKFEDLPLLFTSRIERDLPAYHAIGARGLTYMHVPLVNWAMRTLTQNLYAQLAWDVRTDVRAFADEYFALWYGPYAAKMRRVYELLEESWAHCAHWRAWSAKSVLTQLQRWDGAVPGEPLACNDHFVTPADAVASGQRSIALMTDALTILDSVRREDHAASARHAGAAETVVNPIEARKRQAAGRYENRLGEDRRLLLYGLDTMTVMTELVAYHDALYRRDSRQADVHWQKIEEAADRLDSYYIPIGFEWPGAGLESKDALTRSQVRDVIRRCRAHRTGNAV